MSIKIVGSPKVKSDAEKKVRVVLRLPAVHVEDSYLIVEESGGVRFPALTYSDDDVFYSVLPAYLESYGVQGVWRASKSNPGYVLLGFDVVSSLCAPQVLGSALIRATGSQMLAAQSGGFIELETAGILRDV